MNLPRRDLVRGLLVLGAANLLFLAGTFLAGSVSAPHWRLGFLLRQAHLGRENNLGAWYSAMLLLLVAVAMLLAYLADTQAHDQEPPARRTGRLLRFGWVFLAVIFAGLSWDEMGSFHERWDEIPVAAAILRPVPHLRAWAAVLAVPIALVAMSMLIFAWVHVRRSALAFGLMCAAILLFVTIPVQEHIEATLRMASDDPETYRRPPIHGVIEEGTEVFGSLAFLASALVYTRHRSASIPGNGVRVTLGLRHVLAAAALMSAGLLFVHWHIPHLMYLGDHRGVPQNWVPSAAAALVVVLCALLLRWRRQPSMQPLALGLILMAIIHGMLSIGHATDHVWFHTWFRFGHPASALVRNLISLGVAVAAVLLLWRGSSGTLPRLTLLAWAALLGLALAVDDPFAIPLAVAAYFALMAGLTTQLRRLERGGMPAPGDTDPESGGGSLRPAPARPKPGT